MFKHYLSLTLLFLSIWLSACQLKSNRDNNTIIIHQLTDAKDLNPVTCRDEFSNYLCMQIFQPLLAFDFETTEIIGVLAKEKPTVDTLNNQQLALNFSIREGATFANGRYISAQDVLFSLKAHLCPGVNSFSTQFFRFIDSFEVKKSDSLSFTIICRNNGVSTPYYCGSIQILDKYIYDPKQRLNTYSIADLKSNEAILDTNLLAFATSFNSFSFSQDKNIIKGSGPYHIAEWNKGQHILLQKKKNWWGDRYKNENSFFNATAKNIRYQIISDQTTAAMAFQKGDLDFSDQLQVVHTKSLNTPFNRVKREENNYQYLGFNLQHKFLKEKTIRQAIMLCLDRDIILNNVFDQQGALTEGPMAATAFSSLFPTHSFYEYNPQKAKQLLIKEGWQDENKNGILDKVIDGKRLELRLRYAYNAGNNQRKAVGLFLKQEALKAGIDISIETYDWATYLTKMRSAELEIFYNSSTTNPLPTDFSQLLRKNGQNYFRYQNSALDSLTDLICFTTNETKRKELLRTGITLLNNDLPCIFIFSKHKQMVANKDLIGMYSDVRPHFWAPAFEYDSP